MTMSRALGNLVNDRAIEDSFRDWPHPNIPKERLIQGGFTCINPETSTVACTICGLQVDASSLNGTTPYDFHARRSPQCVFVNPNRHESNRRQTFLYWTGYSGAADIDDLVAGGFYVTESEQGTIRCFCCGISQTSLNQGADIRLEHARLSQNCVFVRSVMS